MPHPCNRGLSISAERPGVGGCSGAVSKGGGGPGLWGFYVGIARTLTTPTPRFPSCKHSEVPLSPLVPLSLPGGLGGYTPTPSAALYPGAGVVICQRCESQPRDRVG
eukprot:753049-Hanusia_phi.AAC.1